MDEPLHRFAGRRRLTPDRARHILRIKYELGIAITWVEHDMQMVADLADPICVLDHGVLLSEGKPEQVLGDPPVIEAYLGTRAVA